LTWVRGQSGNPRGRVPGEQELAPALRRLLRRRDPTTGKQNKLLVAEALLGRALSGEVDAIREVFNRVDGPLRVPLEHSGRDGGPIPIAFDHAAAVAALVAPALAPGSGRDRRALGAAQVPGDGAAVG
jgi:Family of unknown function (DUF5681)